MSSLSNILIFINSKGISPSEFERECNIANATLAKYQERGKDLSSKNIDKISKRYGKELQAAGFKVIDLANFGRPTEKAIVKTEEDLPIVQGQEEEIVTIKKLSQALADQAEANKIQASANDKYAEGFKVLAVVLERMENKMAQEQTQAIIAKTLERMDSNLIETLTGVEFVSKMQLQPLMDQLKKGAADKKDHAKDAGKKSDETNGDGQKSGIKT